MSNNIYSWDEIISSLDAICNLDILQTIAKTQALPTEMSNRAKLLNRLHILRAGDYPVTYEGMCTFSETFCRKYSKERVLTLIQQVIKGEQPYQMEINHSSLTEEEKALLLFVLPLSKTLDATITEN